MIHKVFRQEEYQPFPEKQILDSSKLKQFADDNLYFNVYGEKFSKGVENTVGKGEIARLRAISSFPTMFSTELYRRHTYETRA